MAFDIRRSTVAVWLNVIGALIAIAGLGNKFFPKLFPTLQQPVPVPLWTLLTTIVLSPSVAIWFLRKMNTSSPEPTIEEVPTIKQTPVAAIKSVPTPVEAFESQLLENEILGVLGSGEEWDLNGLTSRLNLTHEEEGAKRVRLAVAILIEKGKIGNTGSGSFSKLKYLSK